MLMRNAEAYRQANLMKEQVDDDYMEKMDDDEEMKDSSSNLSSPDDDQSQSQVSVSQEEVQQRVPIQNPELPLQHYSRPTMGVKQPVSQQYRM